MNQASLYALVVIAAGCSSPKSKACHERMAEAQAVVSAVDSNSLDSVDRSIAAIQSAEATCAANGMAGELTELRAARDRLSSHRVLLVERDERKRSSTLTPEQLDKYVKSGDPNCPKGQGYLHKASGKEIKCTGPRPAEMPRSQAEAYFKAHGFRAMAEATAERMMMEAGGERYVFYYRGENGSAPFCLLIYPKPGIPWQEASSKLTGISPEKFKPGGAVTVSGRLLAIVVDEKNDNARLGECPEKG